MRPRTLKAWAWVHKWTSLVSTLFLLMLGLTGLPLIFFDEIRHLSGQEVAAPAMPADTPPRPLDAVVDAARSAHPGQVPLYLFSEGPDLWLAKMDTQVSGDESRAVFALVDARTARVLDTPVFDDGVMGIVYRLHVDGFAGLPGRLLLGGMGLLMAVAIVSGVVLYAPFMRRLDFGTVRWERSASLRWLDLHNLLGIVTLVWLLVVGLSGVVNSWADLILRSWQTHQTAALQAAAGPAGGGAPPTVQQVLDRARAARPGMTPATLAFPGTVLAAPGHYAVLMHGDSPLTARLQETVLVSRADGQAVLGPPRPALVTALQLAQPLHFGDYGGQPLKWLWAVLDLISVLVLWSGLVLWWRKHRAAARPPSRMPMAKGAA